MYPNHETVRLRLCIGLIGVGGQGWLSMKKVKGGQADGSDRGKGSTDSGWAQSERDMAMPPVDQRCCRSDAVGITPRSREEEIWERLLLTCACYLRAHCLIATYLGTVGNAVPASRYLAN